MNMAMRDFFMFAISFSIIFPNIDPVFRLNVIGGAIGSQLIVYPILCGYIYTFYCQYRYGNVLIEFKRFFRYICILWASGLISLIIGVCIYPYYDILTAGPINQIDKLPGMLSFFKALGISVSSDIIIVSWFIFRCFKSVVLYPVYTFFVSYMVYCWYYKDWNRGVSVFIKGFLAAISFLILFSIVEVLYLSGNEKATELLILITPYFIHSAEFDGTYWPPLLWMNQLRSVFTEPSFIGNYSAVALPVLLFEIFRNQKYSKLCFVYYILISIMIFLTQARTAYVMFLIVNIMFFSFTLWINWRKYYRKIIMLIIVGCMTFAISAFFIGRFMVPNNLTSMEIAGMVVENNLYSLGSQNVRSNGSRFAMLRAHIRVGVDHILIGVGPGLNDSYPRTYLTNSEKENAEIAKWLQWQNKFGILKHPLRAMNGYAEWFSGSGVLGVIILLCPFFYIAFKLVSTIRKDGKLINVFLITSLIGALIAGMNGDLEVIYTVWIVLALAYLGVFHK